MIVVVLCSKILFIYFRRGAGAKWICWAGRRSHSSAHPAAPFRRRNSTMTGSSSFIPVLWFRIRMDPHWFVCPESGSIFGMRIQIQEHGHLSKFTNKLGFLPFKKAFVHLKVWPLTYFIHFLWLQCLYCLSGSRSGSAIKLKALSGFWFALKPMPIHNTALFRRGYLGTVYGAVTCWQSRQNAPVRNEEKCLLESSVKHNIKVCTWYFAPLFK